MNVNDLNRTGIARTIAIMIVLTVPMAFPSIGIPTVQAVAPPPANLVLPTHWSPFGPETQNLLLKEYSDFDTEFTAFQSGQLDLMDWPLTPAQLSAVTTGPGPDSVLTSPQLGLGVLEVDINQHLPLLGILQQAARGPLTSPWVALLSKTTGACPPGLGRLVITLSNQETGAAIDPYNTVSASGFATNTVSMFTDKYFIPSASTCMLSGTYTITSSEYDTGSPPVSVTIDSTSEQAAIVHVNYKSPSTQITTQAGILFRSAIAHLLNKPDFVAAAVPAGKGQCDDFMTPPGAGLPGSPCIAPGGLSGGTLRDQECPFLSAMRTTDPCVGSNYISAYNLAPGGQAGDVSLGGCSTGGVPPCPAGTVWWGKVGSGLGATGGYANPADIEAACLYLSRLFPLGGFTCFDLANESAAASQASGRHIMLPPGQHIVIYIRTEPNMRAYGQIIADSLNFLFGTPNDSGTPATAAVLYGTLGCGTSETSIAVDAATAKTCVLRSTVNWNLYTGEQLFDGGSSAGSTPDSLWSHYHSLFAGNICNPGLGTNPYPPNYAYYCDPVFDALTQAGKTFLAPTAGPSLTVIDLFNEAALRTYQTAMNIPVFSKIQQFAALNAWNVPSPISSLVHQVGHGWEAGSGFWSLLNMRCNASYAPQTTPIDYSCGGGGSSGGFCPLAPVYCKTIRRGLSQNTVNLNPFQATTPWEWDIINDVFDTLFRVNPTTDASSSTGLQVFDWMARPYGCQGISTVCVVCFLGSCTSSSGLLPSYNPYEVSCIGAPTYSTPVCSTGTTTLTYTLRASKFQDGTPVTPNDVCYSIIASRDVPSARIQGSAAMVSSCTTLDASTFMVKLQGTSPFYQLDIGTNIPIIPASGPHSWVAACGSLEQSRIGTSPYTSIPLGPYSLCASPSWDPMAAGLYVGTGPWECVAFMGPTTGNIGGPCTTSGGQTLGTGDQVALLAYKQYVRYADATQNTRFQAISWADVNDDGAINILDIATAAFYFGSPHPYWVHPLYACAGAVVVDICAIATVAFSFDYGVVSLANIDPQIDPFSGCNPYGCVTVQQILNEGGNVHLKLAFISAANGETASLTNVRVQTGGGNAPFVIPPTIPPGTFSWTLGACCNAAGVDLDIGSAWPGNNQVVIECNVAIHGLSIEDGGTPYPFLFST